MPVRLGRFEMPKRLTKEDTTATETYAKFVCNNLCSVILSQIELGIEAEFWPKESHAAILPIRPA